ncbi:MAG TPA: ABC transporter permease [Gemmataceae bacterium]|jgi:ABC-2 type transport system permease protein|nr:ABC transporter permease [Gemmataceae bacterium]
MRKIFVIAAREYKAAVRTKSFLISVLMLPLMMGGSVLVQLLLKDQVDVSAKRFVIVDRTPSEKLGLTLEKAAKERNAKATHDPKTNKQILPEFFVERVAPQSDMSVQRFELSERVRKQEIFGFLEIGADVLKPSPAGPAGPILASRRGAESLNRTQLLPDGFVLRYQSNSPTYDEFYRWSEQVLNQAIWQSRCEAVGVSREKLAEIVQAVPLVVKGLAHRNPATGEIEEGKDENEIASILIPGGLMVLMFMLILVGATPLMHGIVEEKMQRIAEVLLGSVRPFELMLGKLIGMVAVSITLSAVYLGGAYWAVHRYDLAHFMPGQLIAWFLLYQMLAVLMFGSLFIAIGAACTDLRETQSMVWPVMLLVTTPMFIWINVVREPNSSFSTAASFFPFATPMLMVIRLAVPPGVPWWQPLVGILGVLATTLLCVWIGGRIFRLGILLQGKGANMGQLVKWVIRG